MDTARYTVALLLVVTLPPAFLYWLLVHPFAGFWRRLGPVATYLTLAAVLIPGMVAMFRIRSRLLATEFGTSLPLAVLGIACLVASGAFRWWIQRQASNALIAGLPELDPVGHPTPLLTEGPYAWVRHPRYLQFGLAVLGYAFFANYLALYGVLALWIPAAWVIAVVEERELRERFGVEYDGYCRRVPRFLPRPPRTR